MNLDIFSFLSAIEEKKKYLSSFLLLKANKRKKKKDHVFKASDFHSIMSTFSSTLALPVE